MLYLDNASTTPVRREVKECVLSLLDQFYNPSTMYNGGLESRMAIDKAREGVAKFIHADLGEGDVVFTCSGSASNALAILGYCRNNQCMPLYSPMMHSSALKCFKSVPGAFPLKVDGEGIIDLSALEKIISGVSVTPFVALEFANSETGGIQDVEGVISMVHSYGGIVYLDCTGSVPQIPLDVAGIGADMAGFSAHKIGGLKGTGTLYKKKSIRLEPLVYGEQEYGLFGGTENLVGIAAMGKAAESYDYSPINSEGRDAAWSYIRKEIPCSYIVGPPVDSGRRLPLNLYICLRGVPGEAMLVLMDMGGFQIGTGSACASGSLEPSPALAAIGMDEADMDSCIRITFSGRETEDEVTLFCKKLKECVRLLRGL